MGSRVSFAGLGSGIDFGSIVDAVIAQETQRLDLVRAREAQETTRLAQIRSFNTLLLQLRTQAGALADPGDFDVLQAVSSNPTAVAAELTGDAAFTTQSITVNALAQAAQVASQGIGAVDANIGTGTVELHVGGTTTILDITTGNNTLAGLRDAINASDADVTASIINDGSSTNPYRLLLTSNQTGAANAIDVTVNLTGGLQTPNFTDRLIDAAEADAANNAAYTGIAQSAGTFTGTGNRRFLVEITQDGAVGAARFRFSTDGGVTFDDNGGAGYLTSTSNVNLAEGVQVSFTDSGTLTTGDRFYIDVFDPNVQRAQNASVTLGSAAGGGAPITVSSATNTISDLIPGVSLTLNAVTTGPVQISVTQDTATVVDAVTSFVDSFNSVLQYLDDQLDFDPDTEDPSILIGDRLLVSTQNRLRRIVTGLVPGLDGTLNRLSALGITTNIETGRLQIDSATLNTAVSSNLDAVKSVFSTSFNTDNNGVNVVSVGANTRVDADGFSVDITQAARRGSFLGSALGAFPITIDNTNNELRLIVDGQESGVITLSTGTYNTAAELAAEVESRINGASSLGARTVDVTVEGGALRITSDSFGSLSEVRLGAAPTNSAFDVLGLTGGTAIEGLDVAGTIDGEAATGSGQTLTGDAGNRTTDGLVIRVTLDQSQLADGPEANVKVSEGIAKQLRDELTFLTDPVDGRVVRREQAISGVIDDLSEQIADQEERIAARRLSLETQFARLEAALAQITSQGDLLVSQLQNIPRIDTLTQRGQGN